MNETNKSPKTKWWGWGNIETRFSLKDRPGIALYLKNKLGIEEFSEKNLSFDIQKVILPKNRLSEVLQEEIASNFKKEIYSFTLRDRLEHALGKSYRDLIEVRSLNIKKASDVVFFPQNEDDIKNIMKFCLQNKLALIPFGGGTSVVGGVEAVSGSNIGVATLDLKKLNKVTLDTYSQTAWVEAGILGPDLESQLEQQGFVLGHFPQSFEFSTLGGWIAAKSSGQNCLKYGGIEKLVTAIKMISPQGEIKTFTAPRHACGPDMKEILVGTEGVCGVITSALIRLSPKPKEKKYFMYLFKNFKQGQEISKRLACRR
jgi:alkyldihydroxyacetonephosphate synthase